MLPSDRKKVAAQMRRVAAKQRRRAAADLADADALDALAALLDGTEYPAVTVKAYRERHGLTQQQLADRLAVSLTVIRNWEIGRTMPPADVLAGMRGEQDQ